MLVIDGQLHEPPVTRDWPVDESTRHDLLDELQLALMAAVGVDRAVLFPTDLDWALQAAERYPERFTVVPMFSAGGRFGLPAADALEIEAEIERLSSIRGVVGFRIVRTVPDGRGGHVLAPAEAFDRLAAACARAGLAVFMSTVGDLVTPGVLAERHPEIAVVVDHLGLPQPPSYKRASPPFRALAELLALARHPNLAVKCSGLPTLSTRPYPFDDLWPHLHAVIDAFGPERVMWGSDFSRVLGRAGFHFRIPGGEQDYQGKHTYAQALHYLADSEQLDRDQKGWILGRTAQRLLNWP
jgi:L-fuconolactonase